ncbi:hypothetical protein LLE49_15950 [Alicyclobacillus tolerans]|uniref:hypothetical protein n=1 Tax=Alicyclobacillus tolerans TaxID=90970 RepID=UPI001F2204F6|nr:hypothetical protein [Alicyclobacillus tolerans]MCF8566219.1 hypothetical protein [Alicyclobacillus tolerans]
MNSRTQKIMEEYKIPGYEIGRKVYAIQPGDEYVQLTLGLLEPPIESPETDDEN